MLSVTDLKREVTARNIKFSIIAQLASEIGAICYGSDVTSFFNGRHIAPVKGERIRAACKRLIDLIDADDVRLDLSTVENVERAEKRLAANKGRGPVVVTQPTVTPSVVHEVLAVDNASPERIAKTRAKKDLDRSAAKAASEVLSQ
jgi:hypothetical protein